MQFILTPVPFNAATPALTTPNAACELIVKHGPQHPPYVLATEETTIIEPYLWSFAVELG